jgi:hypothetical protein
MESAILVIPAEKVLKHHLLTAGQQITLLITTIYRQLQV